MGNKGKYSEKAKKSSTFFETCEVSFFGESRWLKLIFRAGYVKVRTGTYFVTKNALELSISKPQVQNMAWEESKEEIET